MTKAELITNVANKLRGTTKSAVAEIIDTAIEEVVDTVANGEKVAFSGILTIEPVDVAERKGRNPKTGEEVIVPAHKKIHVKIGKNFKDAVNE